MLQQSPETETKPIAEARAGLDEVVRRVRNEEVRVILEEHGEPLAVLVSTEDLRRLRRLDEQMSRRRQLLQDMREPFRNVPPEEIERETDRILDEIRAENRRARPQAVDDR